MEYTLHGIWDAVLTGGERCSVTLPGTLDENQVGQPDHPTGAIHPDEALGQAEPQSGPITTRLTRKYTYEGPVTFSRAIRFQPSHGQRVFLEAERARSLELRLNGENIPHFVPQTLSTPHIFELTGKLTGEDQLELCSDNSYPGMPREAILNSSAATDETQTNWNGIVGRFCLVTRPQTFFSGLRVYPHGKQVQVDVELDALEAGEDMLTLTCEAFSTPVRQAVSCKPGKTSLRLEIPVRADAARWDEYEGNLYTLTAALNSGAREQVTFGLRSFDVDESGRFTLNGRRIFLRSEANCAVFPETGYSPMDLDSWMKIFRRYQDYGVNCVRFHSYCPPQAAFEAGDQLGILIQPELSQWDPRTAFESPEAWSYYITELEAILTTYANHPSFVLLTFGNELHAGELGHQRMDALLRRARELDPTRRYAEGSNPHYGARAYGQENGFYTAQEYLGPPLRGTFSCGENQGSWLKGYINNQYPSADVGYDQAVEQLRQDTPVPVFSFEVGQFQVLPELEEIDRFQGVTDPVNLRVVRERAKAQGLEQDWKDMVQASGELARLAYREEVEAALRTPGMSGISLLGLQDFPGQGTALVGMMDSHFQPKSYSFAQPKAFQAFFRAQLPLVLLPRYTFTCRECLHARVKIANYGKKPLAGRLIYTLSGDGKHLTGNLGEVMAPVGELTDAGELELPLDGWSEPVQLELKVGLDGAENVYPLWVYPDEEAVCPSDVLESRQLDEAVWEKLRQGGTVYLTPPSTPEALPRSIKGQFTTDFWSTGTFPNQEGGMGLLIDSAPPIFRTFPTQFYTNWQWWPMACQRAVELPRGLRAIVTQLDTFSRLRHLGMLFECRCGGGQVLFSSMDLNGLKQYPEARALQRAIYRYLDSPDFCPEQELSVQALTDMLSQNKPET